jgi:hypothetical protein
MTIAAPSAFYAFDFGACAPRQGKTESFNTIGREQTPTQLQLGQQRPLTTAPSGRQERLLCSGYGRSSVSAEFTIPASMRSLSPPDLRRRERGDGSEAWHFQRS